MNSITIHHNKDKLTHLGPYKILEPLAKGGMSQLYRGEHVGSGRHVALKVVPMPHKELFQTIRREIYALSRLDHPGIIKIEDHGVFEDLPWYAMDLIKGKTLKHIIAELYAKEITSPGNDRSPASVRIKVSEQSLETQKIPYTKAYHERLLRLIHNLCHTLTFLHGEGIVHRDLKPGNILVNENEKPIIVDFGLTLMMRGQMSREPLIPEKSPAGTVDYMAPEQILNDVVDARADLYSVGCIMYEIISGHPPFSGESRYEIQRAHLLKEPLSLDHLVHDIPSKLVELVDRLLLKDLTVRLGYAEDVASQLAQVGIKGESLFPEKKKKTYLYRPQFQGRESMLNVLQKKVNSLIEGKGSLVFISGESGIGKTRLINEFGLEARQKNILVMACECFQGNVSPRDIFQKPLLFIADLCHEKGREEVDRVIGERGKVLVSLAPALAALPGQDHYPEPSELPMDAARLRLFGSLAKTFEILATDTPILFLIDDLQWADDFTLGFLTFLYSSRFLESRSILILGTYRSDEVSDQLQQLIERSGMEPLHLDGLDSKAVTSMVNGMLALPKSHKDFSLYMAKHSEGNPLFVAEYLRVAIDEGLIFRGDTGTWNINEFFQDMASKGPDEMLPLPLSLKQLIVRHIQSLSTKECSLTENAAIFGREVKIEYLMDMMEWPDDDFYTSLDELIKRQIFEKTGLNNIMFTHDQIRKVVYDQIELSSRVKLHVSAVRTIETRESKKIQEHAEILAQHCIQGELWEKSLIYLKYAGDNFKAMFEHHMAVEYYSKYEQIANDHCKEPLDDDLTTRNELFNVLLEAGDIFRYTNQLEKAENLYNRLYYLAEKYDSDEHTVLALNYSGETYMGEGKFDECEKIVKKAYHLAEKMNDSVLMARSEFVLGLNNHWKQDFPQAVTFFSKAIERIEHSDEKKLLCNNFYNLACAEMDLGDHHQAWSHFEKAEGLALESKNELHLTQIYLNKGILASKTGDYDTAFSYLKKASSLAEKIQYWRFAGNCYSTMANLYTDEGDYLQALTYGEKSLECARKIKDLFGEGYALYNLGRTHIERNESEQAMDCLEKSKTLAEKTGDKFTEALDEILIGHLISHNDIEQGRKKIEKGLNIAKAISMADVEAVGIYYLALTYLSSQPHETVRLLKKVQEFVTSTGDRFLAKKLQQLGVEDDEIDEN